MRRLTAAALTAALAAGATVALAAGPRLAVPTAVADTPSQQLDRARASFRENDFATAIPLLNYLLYPKARLSQDEDLIEAHLLLGACSFEIGDTATAAAEFEEVLASQPELDLEGSPLFSPGVIKLFGETKAAFRERQRQADERRRIAEERDRYQQLLASLVVVEKRSYYINYIPFGAGQFQNRQRKKGAFFAVSQGLTGATSAGIWLYLVGSYGLSGTVPDEEAPRVRRLQQIEIVSGTACLALMAWGIVDSLLNYEPSAQRRPDESLLPPDLRRKPAGRPEGAPTVPTSWMLTPTPLDGGAALSLTVEF